MLCLQRKGPLQKGLSPGDQCPCLPTVGKLIPSTVGGKTVEVQGQNTNEKPIASSPCEVPVIRETIGSDDGEGANYSPAGISIRERLISPSPTVVAEIAGVELGCVLDTGAEASIIPSDVFHSQIETQTGNVDLLNAPMRIIGVTGTEVPVEGYVRARVRVGGREAMVGFLVVPRKSSGERRQKFPVLLGCNALRTLLEHDLADGEFEFAGQCINLSKRIATEAWVQTKAAEVTVPARSVQSVRCTIDARGGGQTGDNLGLWFVEGECEEHGTSLQAVEGCILDGDSTDIILINTSNHDVILPLRCKVARAIRLEEHSEVDVQITDNSIQVDICETLVMAGGIAEGNEYAQDPPPNSTPKTSIRHPLPTGVSLDGLEPSEAARVEQLLHEHSTVFSRDEFDLGHCNLIPHQIKLSSDKPIRLPYRRIPTSETMEVRQLLQDMLEKNIIRRSSSPFASPVVLVRKKSGAIRLCIDYRQLNAITVKDSFPLPRIDESLEAMEGARFFSSLDLSHGYFQVSMDPDFIPLTAFRVPWGLFEFQRMPQGLCNSPSTFQRTMERRALWTAICLHRDLSSLPYLTVFGVDK